MITQTVPTKEQIEIPPGAAAKGSLRASGVVIPGAARGWLRTGRTRRTATRWSMASSRGTWWVGTGQPAWGSITQTQGQIEELEYSTDSWARVCVQRCADEADSR
jgi:hypothetical protein